MEGHPDKLCDLIADAIVDDYLRHDPDAKVACEVLVAKQLVVIAGEISSDYSADLEALVRDTLADIGYTALESGISAASCRVEVSVSGQSPYLSQLVRPSLHRLGLSASDQAVVVGFATSNMFGMVPRASHIAKRLAIDIARSRRENPASDLRPDGKTLVCLTKDDGVTSEHPVIVVSAQHAESAKLSAVRELLESLTLNALSALPIERPFRLVINPPTGVFHFGGPAADTGLTGRKVVADTYGPDVSCGGGALSGKDPSKIDRCATYAARWVAKSLVAAGLATSLRVSLTYVIGDAAPIAVEVVTDNSLRQDELLVRLIREKFDLRPGAIIERLDLRRPIYYLATRRGHIGLDESLPWEVPTLAF